MKPKTLLISLLLFTALLFAACGNNSSSSDSSSSGGGQALPTPTAMSGSFKAVGEQTIITKTAEITETSQTSDSVAAAGVDLSVGQRAYEKNKCGDCHGAKGEGVADKGKAVAGTTLSFEDFDKFLRTGGGQGNDHIFGRSAVSPKGMESLYAYVKGLK